MVKPEEEEDQAEDIQKLLDPFLFCEPDDMLAYPAPDLVHDLAYEMQPCLPAVYHHEEWAVPQVVPQGIMLDFSAVPAFIVGEDDFLL